MNKHVDVLILGAGPTGLGAAWRLGELKHSDWLLCEAEEVAGGLAGSVIDMHGFVWDFGGHVQFSHYDYFDRLMDELLGPEGWLHHERQSWIWFQDRFIPYPFQLNLHYLSQAERDACLAGIKARPDQKASPRDFGEWIDTAFGSGIAEKFLRPYNLKVWGYPLERLSWQWISERVATLKADYWEQSTCIKGNQASWGPNHLFRFPQRGGTGVVWRTLAHQLDLRHPGQICMKRRAVNLDTVEHKVRFSDGETICYGRLLSTIPLDSLVQSSDLAEELGRALADLKHTSTHVIGIGLHGCAPDYLIRKNWIYFPDAKYPFYRVTVFSRYSPRNVPDPQCQWSLLTEVSESPYAPVDSSTILERVVQGLISAGFIADYATVHHIWHRRLEYGYPTPSLGRDQALDRILPRLEARQIYSRGRFGAWKYEVSNQDHCFAQGVEVVNHWLQGDVEITLHHPEVINNRHRPETPVREV